MLAKRFRFQAHVAASQGPGTEFCPVRGAQTVVWILGCQELPFKPFLYLHFAFFTFWNTGMMPNDAAASMDYGNLRQETCAKQGGAESQKGHRFWVTSWSPPTISFGILASLPF